MNTVICSLGVGGMTHARFLHLAKCEREGEGSDSVVARTLERSGSREMRAEVLLGGARDRGHAFLRLAGTRGYTKERVQIFKLAIY